VQNNKEKRKEYEKKKRKEIKALKRVDNLNLSESIGKKEKKKEKINYIGQMFLSTE
jgi:hypothetical protein